MKRLALLVMLVALAVPGRAQNVEGRLSFDVPDGENRVDVTFQLRALGAPFNLGLSAFQFSFDPAEVAFPAEPEAGADGDFAFLGFDAPFNPNYAATVTRPAAGRVSVNIFHFTGEGTGDAVGTGGFVDVAVLRFDIVSSALPTMAFTRCETIAEDFAIIQGDCNGFVGSDIALPVELAAFEATANGDAVLLRWASMSEVENLGYNVEHRPPTEATGAGTADWRELGFVEGAGTTSEAQQYAYRVEALVPGRHRFRLRQLDYNGGTTVGPEVEVAIEIATAFVLSAAYPNPFNPRTQFALTVARAQPVRIDVFNILGQHIRTLFDGELPAQRQQTFAFEADGLPSGLYFIRVAGPHIAETRRVMLMK